MKRKMSKAEEIEIRVIKEAEYIIKHDITIREAANRLFVSKSTLHMDLSKRLPLIDEDLYKKVKAILDKHANERYRKGGIAAANKRLTRKKNGGKY